MNTVDWMIRQMKKRKPGRRGSTEVHVFNDGETLAVSFHGNFIFQWTAGDSCFYMSMQKRNTRKMRRRLNAILHFFPGFSHYQIKRSEWLVGKALLDMSTETATNFIRINIGGAYRFGFNGDVHADTWNWMDLYRDGVKAKSVEKKK